MCDPKTKSCIFKDCINLPDVENGKVLGYSKSVGSRLSAKCSMYYKPKNGKRQAFCTAKGTWKPSLECIPMKKCKIPQIENGEVSGDSDEVGSKISLTCNEHYQVEDDIDESYCTPRGEWEPPMECQRIPGCIDLPQIKNGKIVGESTELGSKISVTCNQYLEAKDGISESICTENGWNPMMECVPKHGICDELDAPENLTLKDGNGTAVGSIRTFSCPPDFVDIETSLTWTCQPAGNWDGVASKCVPKKCSNVRCYAFYDGSFLVVQSEENIPADTPEICISKCEELMGDNLKSVLFKTIKVEKNNCKCNDETLTPDEVLMPWFSAYSYFTY
ncbi:Sushi [Mactra antiquata]